MKWVFVQSSRFANLRYQIKHNYMSNFQPLEVVSRYREPQLQVAENDFVKSKKIQKIREKLVNGWVGQSPTPTRVWPIRVLSDFYVFLTWQDPLGLRSRIMCLRESVTWFPSCDSSHRDVTLFVIIIIILWCAHPTPKTESPRNPLRSRDT